MQEHQHSKLPQGWIQVRLGDVVQPYRRTADPQLHQTLPPNEENHLKMKAFRGVELVDDVTKLGAMNLLLHGIGPIDKDCDELPIVTSDSLNHHPGEMYNVILTNPPFGKKSSITFVNEQGEKERRSLSVVRNDFIVSTSNKQLNFLQHILTILKEGGRAAVVLPDNVLFEGGVGETLRHHLIENFEVHTLLRLPTGIFYAQGVNANVIFFDYTKRNKKPSTRQLWVYDLRSNTHFTLRTKPWERSDLNEFISCFNPENRRSRQPTWSNENLNGRWRAFSYDELIKRDKCNLDISWFEEFNEDNFDEFINPEKIANEILLDLQSVVKQINGIVSDLSNKN